MHLAEPFKLASRLMRPALVAALALGALPPPAAAQALRSFWACRADYRRFCAEVPRGDGRIVACLDQHAAELSPDCSDALRKSGIGPAAAPPAGGSVEHGVAYGRDPAQTLDVYRPAQARGAPMLLLVHGGGWRRGDKALSSTVDSKVGYWLPKGVVVISINYRMLPEADPREQARDVARALAFVQAKARGWGADPARVVLMGHSAGAHLVSLLSADPRIAYKLGARPWLATVSLDSAAMNVVSIMQHRHFPLYDKAFGSSPDYWRDVSPFHRLAGTVPPMMLVCSTRRSDPCPQAEEFAAKARAAGGHVEVLPVAMSHLQINAVLGDQSGYTAAVEAFLRQIGLP
jgi:arylformamidase